MRMSNIDIITNRSTSSLLLAGLLWTGVSAWAQSVRVVPSALIYDETSTNATGFLTFILSEPPTESVYVRLVTLPAVQSNLVFATTNALRISAGVTNSQPLNFSIPDGTLDSQMLGIELIPELTNSYAIGRYLDVQSANVFVKNLRPRVTNPVSRDIADTPLPPYNTIAMGVPFLFGYTVADVPADSAGMAVTWDFGDGVIQTVNNGLSGQISHTYTSLGDKIVRVQATDKDGGASDEVVFKVTLVPPPPPPTVRVLSPVSPLYETSIPNTASVAVQLSEAFTNSVLVQLNVTPANSALSGTLLLSTNRWVIPPGQTEVTNYTLYLSPRDGTPASLINGFTITPQIVSPPTAVAHYQIQTPAVVMIANAAPVINYPIPSDITSDSVVYTILNGVPWTFYWDVTDSASDLATLAVSWNFGDGTSSMVYGGSGSIVHTYTSPGDKLVHVCATDKDGGTAEIMFKVRVLAPVGFELWAASKGLSGDLNVLFALDRNGDGIANGFEYAFGTNLTEGLPLLTVRMVNGQPRIETPKRDIAAFDAYVVVQGCTNLLSGDWSLPIGPLIQTEKPEDRDWYAPLVGVPDNAFFRLRAILD